MGASVALEHDRYKPVGKLARPAFLDPEGECVCAPIGTFDWIAWIDRCGVCAVVITRA